MTSTTKDDLKVLNSISSDIHSSLNDQDLGVPNVTSGTVLTKEELELLRYYEILGELHVCILALDSIRSICSDGYDKERNVQFVPELTTDAEKAAEEEYARQLDEEIEELYHREKLKNLAVENILVTLPVKEAVYETKVTRQGALLPLLKERDELEHDILRLTKDSRQLEEKLEQLTVNSMNSHAKTRTVLSSLAAAKTQQKKTYSKISKSERESYNKIFQEISTQKKKASVLAEVIPVSFKRFVFFVRPCLTCIFRTLELRVFFFC